MDFFYKEKKREREIVRMYLARWREGEVARGLEVKGSRGLEVKIVRGILSGKTTSSSFPTLNVSQESFVP